MNREDELLMVCRLRAERETGKKAGMAHLDGHRLYVSNDKQFLLTV